MDIATMLSISQTILAGLQCTELREICSVLHYKDDLEKLQMTVETIHAVLLDAANKEDAAAKKEQFEMRLYIKRLEEAVYEADDLIDKYVTLAQQKKLTKGSKLPILPLLKELSVACEMSRGVKKIRENLANIADIHNKYGLSSVPRVPQVIRTKREETGSSASDNIIGRDEDVQNIKRMMFDSGVQSDVSFLTIVGIGGLGKTALTQVLYNDQKVKDEFSLMAWACVSDQDSGELNVKNILGQILASATREKLNDYTCDVIQNKFRELIVGKKFLLVLDDVWTENRNEWLKLEGHLKGGKEGSLVLVTTRSTKTANAIGTRRMYPLKGLSDENAWSLFERIAFGEADKEVNSRNELVDIGQKIIKMCANVPLAIRVVGALLFDQPRPKWKRVLEIGLANIKPEENGIMPILKYSYNNLEAPIKSCFSYCALFPKDFKIKKHMLVRLWMAQGYVIPEEGQSIDDAAEDYFLVLLQRCFFQDVSKDLDGMITSCKIHDLMHDIALEVSGYKFGELNSNHVFVVMKPDLSTDSPWKSRIRSYLQVLDEGNLGMDGLLVRNLLANCLCLRTLDLRESTFKTLPDSIGKLLHLRYLDLSRNRKLELIPKSITKLHNLIFLGIENCIYLKCLPLGMGKMTNLRTLERFMVGKTSEKLFFDELENLKSLHLRGVLELEIFKGVPSHKIFAQESSKRGEYLSGMQHLDWISINIERYIASDLEEALLDSLCPHSNPKGLRLRGYNGLRVPIWWMPHKPCPLSNLVDLAFEFCYGLESLPCLGKLLHLKKLCLSNLDKLEYIEESSSNVDASNSSVGGSPYLPCLVDIKLVKLPKLRSWWLGSCSLPFLPRLEECRIEDCPKMMPRWLLPNVRIDDDEKRGRKQEEEKWYVFGQNLRRLRLGFSEMVNLPEGIRYMTSLQHLSIYDCEQLQSVPWWMPNLTALESLIIRDCTEEIEERCKEPNGVDCHLLRHISEVDID